MEYVLFVVVGFFGSIVSAIFGFGTALLVLAIGSHILPVKETIVLATVLFTASTITKSFLFARHIDWKTVILMSLGSLPFAYLGAELLVETPPVVAKRLLGLMVLLYLFLDLIKRVPAVRLGTIGIIASSGLYGFLSGLLGSGNIVKVVLLREMKMTKEAFVGVMAASSVLANIVKLISYGTTGLMTSEMLLPAFALILCAIFMAFIGRIVLGKIETHIFEVGLKILLGVAAFALVI